MLSAVLAMLAGLVLVTSGPFAAAAQVPVPTPPVPSGSTAPGTPAPTPTAPDPTAPDATDPVPSGTAASGPGDLGETVPGAVPLPPAGTQEPAGQTCFLIIDKVDPGETVSDVVGSGCHTGPATAPAQVPTESDTGTPSGGPTTAPSTGPTRFRAQSPALVPAQTQASTVPLAELYADTNYGGKSFIVYGNQGPCDASGYTISDSTTPNTTVGGISSFRAYNNCNNQKLYNQTGLRGTPAGYVGAGASSVPAAYDNKVLSLRLRTNCTAYSSTASVCGAIRDKYEALGGPAGSLGYPTSNELTNPDGVGKRNTFQNQGASIYWSPSTGANGVQGLIAQKWGQLGYERGLLGYPATDELTNPDQVGKRNMFAKTGAIYFSPATGAHQISGPIFQSWGAWGYERSEVGYPTSDEIANVAFPWAGPRCNEFRSGWIWSGNTGQTPQMAFVNNMKPIPGPNR